MRLITILFLFLSCTGYGQTPSSCFEIQSVLADACGTVEGENEMVRFIVGPAALNTANLSVTWPNNPYRGICQNANTATKVATLNAGIQGCGFLLEPIGGILPAGAQVILVTSEDFNTAANSFTNLNDTLYIIFQCSGNTNGHFANYNSTPGIRTLTMVFNPPAGCSDQVAYDISQLTNQNGGFGGGSALQNGGRIDYDFAGNPTYANSGCQAPFVPVTANAGPNKTSCDGDTVLLTGVAGGEFDSLRWSGGTGTFLNGNNDTTLYVPGTGETGTVTLTLEVFTACADTISSSTTVTISNSPVSTITASGPLTFCAGNTVTLTAGGGGSITWNTGALTPGITVGSSGFYFFTATSVCGTDSAGVNVVVNPLPATSINTSGPLNFCSGDSVTLIASGADSYLWSTGSTNDSITVKQSGTYLVTGTNSCGTLDQSVVVNVSTIPAVTITAAGNTSFCQGSSVVLNASSSSGGTITWSEGSTGSSITVTTAGTFTATATNQCGTGTSAPISTSITPAPTASIIGDDQLCLPGSLTLAAVGTGSILWNTGDTARVIAVSSAGTYTVTISNSCGQDVASTTISSSSVTADFSATPVQGTAPLTVQFTNNSSPSATYSWNFGDNTSSTEINPDHVYTAAGTFQAELIATNSAGCKDTLKKEIVVLVAESFLEVPNVFTPNGDNLNDAFVVKHRSIVEFSLMIYDRWGKLIAEIPTVTSSWDGTLSSGKKASDGTYFYKLKAKGADDKVYDLTGFLTLLR